MTQMIEEVLEPAMKAQAQRDPADFVYTPPEVWMQQVMNVGARVVNRAITIAYEEWEKAEATPARTIRHESKPTLQDIQSDNEVRWQPGHTNDVLGI
jgi:hypothetical protein